MSSENIVSKKYRVLINKVWNRISFWTKASDVEFSSGKTAQETLGSIMGISDSLTSTNSSVAASAYAVKKLNDKLTEIANTSRPIVTTKDLTKIGVMQPTEVKYGLAFKRCKYDYKTATSTYTIPNGGALAYYSNGGAGTKYDTNGNATDFGSEYICSLTIPLCLNACVESDYTYTAFDSTDTSIPVAQYQGSSYKTNQNATIIGTKTYYNTKKDYTDMFYKSAVVDINLYAFDPGSTKTEQECQEKLDDVMGGKVYNTSYGNYGYDENGAGVYSKKYDATLWVKIYKKPNSYDIIEVMSNNDYSEHIDKDSFSNSTVTFNNIDYWSDWSVSYNTTNKSLVLKPRSTYNNSKSSYGSTKRLDTHSSSYETQYNNLPSDYYYVGCSTNNRYEYYSKANSKDVYYDSCGRCMPYVSKNIIYPVVTFYKVN